MMFSTFIGMSIREIKKNKCYQESRLKGFFELLFFISIKKTTDDQTSSIFWKMRCNRLSGF